MTLTITAHRGAIEIRPSGKAQFLIPCLTYYEKSIPTKTVSFFDKVEGKVVEREVRGTKIISQRVAMYQDDDEAIVTHEGLLARVMEKCREKGVEVNYRKLSPQFPKQKLDKSIVRGLHQDQVKVVIEALSVVGVPGFVGTGGTIIDATMGWGKTYLIAALCRAYGEGKTVITTKSKAVVHRIYSAMKELLKDDGLKVGIRQGATRTPGDVIVCTNLLLDTFDEDEVDCLIYDECHHSVSPGQAKLVISLSRAVKFGLSATVGKRFDGKEALMEGLFGPKCSTVTDKDAEDLGRVVPMTVYVLTVDKGPDLFKLGSPVAKERHGIWRNACRNQLIRDAAAMIPPDQQLLIFIRTEEHGSLLMEKYLPEGFEFFHGKLGDREYKRILSGFESGELKRVISTDSMGEGVDPSNLRVVIDANWTSSDQKVSQRAGRNRRHGDGKSRGYLITFDDAFHDTARAKSDVRIKRYRDRGYTVTEISSVEEIVIDELSN